MLNALISSLSIFIFQLFYFTNAIERKNITLRGVVFHAPPFAMVENDTHFSGFQPDLIERIKIFALEDNVKLNFILSPSSATHSYNDALDLIANNCNSTANPNLLEDCHRFDVLVGDYYCNADRFQRVDFTPAWLQSTMSTMKYLDKTGADFNTIKETVNAGEPICGPEGTFLLKIFEAKYPDANLVRCSNQQACIDDLKAGKCVLLFDDELQLRYRAANDVSLHVTREAQNTQYLTWPINYNLDRNVSMQLKSWIYRSITNATTDDLYFKYFTKELCPVGTAGEKCELPCHPVYGTSDERGVCVCMSARWTGSDCSTEVMENKNLIPLSVKAIGYTMVAVNFTIVSFCAVWLIWKRDTKQVKFAQPFFLGMVLLGCTISTSTIIPLSHESSGDGPVHGCLAIPWSYSVGFSITFGTLFSKIRRVYLLFKSAVICRRKVITATDALKNIGVVLAFDIIPLIAWTVLDPLTWKREVLQTDKLGHPLSSIGRCTSEHWKYYIGAISIVHLSLLGIASYMCYVSRKIPTTFSESKHVTMATISNLQIFVVGLPLLFIGASDPKISYFVRSIIIWMNDFVVVAIIFGNLIYSEYTKRDEDPDLVVALNKFGTRARSSSIATIRPITARSAKYENQIIDILPKTMAEFQIAKTIIQPTGTEQFGQGRRKDVAEKYDDVSGYSTHEVMKSNDLNADKVDKAQAAEITRNVSSEHCDLGSKENQNSYIANYETTETPTSESEETQARDLYHSNPDLSNLRTIQLSGSQHEVIEDDTSSPDDLNEIEAKITQNSDLEAPERTVLFRLNSI